MKNGKRWLYAPLCLLLLLTLTTFGKAAIGSNDYTQAQGLLDKKINLQLKDVTLREALSQIEKIAKVKFSFRSKLISAHERITMQANQEMLASILDKIFSTRQIKYEVDGQYIVLTKKDQSSSAVYPPALEQGMEKNLALRISGTVRDETTKEAIPGVSILLKGTSLGTATDADGKFSLSLPEESTKRILVFSFIGYLTEEVVVTTETVINVTLVPDIKALNEVVVVGYGTQKKRDVIGSITSVPGENLTMRAMPNFEAGLQGQVAGAMIQSQSGAPGAPVRILVRGPSSLNLSTDPLYIIDGMPISVSSYGLGASNQSPMALINQNDIESIEVLKDAAATSIYGSRASNGVIIVTTKSGKKSEGGATSFSYTTGFSQLTRTPDQVGYANTQQWFAIMDEAYKNSSPNNNGAFPDDLSGYYNRTPGASTPLASPKLTRAQAENIQTNWFDELFRTGTFQSYNFSSLKGTDKTAFYLSANYRQDKGVQKNNNLERFTVRSNLDFNPSENLTIRSRLTFGYTKNEQQNSGITTITDNALPWFPVRELGNPNRYFNAYIETGNAAARSDPKNYLNQTEQYRALGGVALAYRVPKIRGLSLQTELSGDLIQSNRLQWESREIRANTDNKPQSTAEDEALTYHSVNYNAYARFERSSENHSITLTGGAEGSRTAQSTRQMLGSGLKGNYPDLQNPDNRLLITSRPIDYERYLLAYFGRASYKFKDRYLFETSARRDGSSIFAPQNRWGTFVAVSAGWIISDEAFMAFLGKGTFIKLRGSYGEIGNQNVPDTKTININNSQYYGEVAGTTGTVPTNIPVTDLQWERTQSSDLGIDFGFFGNRINGSLAYYNRYVKGMVLRAGLPLSTGIWSPNRLVLGDGSYEYRTSNTVWGNFGNMVNRGVELELHTTNVDKGNFKWKTDLTLSFNRNIVKGLTSDIDKQGRGLENIYGNTVSRTGGLRGMWYVADYAGVDSETGIPMIYALDTETLTKTGETRRLKQGEEDVRLPATTTNIRANRFYQEGKSGDPKYQGGLTNTFSYKGLDLSILLVFSGGNSILDYDRQRASVVNETRNMLTAVYDQAWRNPGDQTAYPQLRDDFSYLVNGVTVTGFDASNTYHNGQLYKGDFVRLRNVQIGYTVPAAVVQKIKMKDLRVYVSGSNLLTLTSYPGFDPEGTGTTQDPLNQNPGFVYFANAIPQLRTFTIGLDVKF